MARRYDLQSDLPWTQKLLQLSWGLIFLLTLVACVGFTALYSAANGHLDPWASRQIVRFLVGVCGMIFVAMIDIRSTPASVGAYHGVFPGSAGACMAPACPSPGFDASTWARWRP